MPLPPNTTVPPNTQIVLSDPNGLAREWHRYADYVFTVEEDNPDADCVSVRERVGANDNGLWARSCMEIVRPNLDHTAYDEAMAAQEAWEKING